MTVFCCWDFLILASRRSVFLFFDPFGLPAPLLGSLAALASLSRVFLFFGPLGLPLPLDFLVMGCDGSSESLLFFCISFQALMILIVSQSSVMSAPLRVILQNTIFKWDRRWAFHLKCLVGVIGILLRYISNNSTFINCTFLVSEI